MLAFAAPAAAQGGAPPQWSPELADAFDRYELGDFSEVQRLCRAVQGDARVRDDAEALAALANMRSGERAERLFGRAALREICNRRPGLEQRPECLFALGVAARELTETAGALLALSGARDRFVARGDLIHTAQTAVELAETWRRHNEWERMDPALGVVAPATPEGKAETRRTHIAALAADAASWPISLLESRIAIEVTLARVEIDLPATRAAGRARLERCSTAMPVSAASATACMLLADLLEADGEPASAIPLLERARQAPSKEVAESAARRLTSITRPQIEIESPDVVVPDTTAQIRFRARNIPTIRVELRQVDLPAWLESRRGVMADAQLPVSGALLGAGESSFAGVAPHAWAQAETGVSGLPEIKPPVGAYVIVATGTAADGTSLTVRKLLLASAIDAAAIVGSERGILWAPGAGADARASFWVAGGYVPLRIELRDGITMFDLPGETRILRDRRWTCLLQSGNDVALLRGTLPGREPAPRVVLAGGPASLAHDETCTLFGIVEDLPKETAESNVTVEWLDSSDRLVAAQVAPRGEGGAFSVSFRPGEALAGQVLRAQARIGNRALDPVDGRFSLRVESEDVSPARAWFLNPAQVLPNETKLLDFVFATSYPGDVPMAGALYSIDVTAVPLPLTLAPISRPRITGRNGAVNERGQASLNPPLADFGWDERPLAAIARGVVTTWDKRGVTARATALVGTSGQVWATLPGPPTLGTGTQFEIHWVDALGRAADVPKLEIRGPSGEWRGVALDAAPIGFRSVTWYPSVPGRYAARCTLPLTDGTIARFEDTFDVAGEAGGGNGETYVRSAVRPESQGPVVLRITGRHATPLVAWVEGQQPAAAQSIAELDGDAELTLSDDGDGQMVYLAEVLRGRLRILDGVPIQAATSPKKSVTLDIRSAPEITGTVTLDRKLVRRLWIRVSPALEASGLDWSGEALAEARHAEARTVIAGSRMAAQPGESIRLTLLPDDVNVALRGGATLWAKELSVEGAGAAELSFAAPSLAEHARYRVNAIWVDQDGQFHVESKIVERSDAPRIALESPRELTVGDRFSARVVVQGVKDASVRWRLDPGARCVALGPTSGEGATKNGELRVSIPLEVASEGEGDLAVTIDSAGREFSQRVKVRGHAATAASPANPELRVTRTLYRLDPVIGPDHAELPEGRWNRLPVAPGEPVTPGTLLLLECRVRSPNALHSLKWRQRMPANCVSLGNDLREIRVPGRTTLARSFALEFEGVGISAGDTVFEIPMAMVGGGTCVVPMPEVIERTKSLAIESDDLRISGAGP